MALVNVTKQLTHEVTLNISSSLGNIFTIDYICLPELHLFVVKEFILSLVKNNEYKIREIQFSYGKCVFQ